MVGSYSKVGLTGYSVPILTSIVMLMQPTFSLRISKIVVILELAL